MIPPEAKESMDKNKMGLKGMSAGAGRNRRQVWSGLLPAAHGPRSWVCCLMAAAPPGAGVRVPSCQAASVRRCSGGFRNAVGVPGSPSGAPPAFA